jgi:NADP-dependent 3-hydroxy acid dehydrogenase YdfG/Flp pilus assembly protein TadD
MSQLYITYCEANKSVATDIIQKLGKVKISFTPLSSKLVNDDKGLTFLIAETNQPGILLLSDNFLKSQTCMMNMLNFVQNSAVAENMKIVIIDGQYATGDVETTFDRVSSVIKYMNYWQEKYLEMRKQKRSVDSANEDAFNEKLQNVKNISSEIGDFLRLIRNKDFWTYDQLVFNNFDVFFKHFGEIGQHQAYIKTVKTSSSTSSQLNVSPPKELDRNKILIKEEEITNVPIAAKEVKEANTLNETIKKKQELNKATNNPPRTLHEKLAAQLNKENPIKEELEEEELIIEEVLQEVENAQSSTQVIENSFSVSNINNLPNKENVIESIDAQAPVDPSNISNTNKIESNIEDDFDSMDGIDIEDITDEFEGEILINSKESVLEKECIEDVYEEDEIEEVQEIKESVPRFFKDSNEMTLSAAMNAANAYMMNGAHREGMKAFETLLEDYPNNIEIRYHYAHNLREEVSDQEKATTHFEKIVKLDPTHYPSYKALAEISEQNNDFLLAKSYYEKVIYLNPDVEGVYYKLGLITAGFYAEKPKLAISYFKKAILQNPNNEDAYYRLALIYAEQKGGDKKALKNYLKTLKINPHHPFANYDLALLYYKMGDQKNAAKYYKKAWNINAELKTDENDLAFKFEEKKKKNSNIEISKERKTIPFIDNDKVVLITGATSGIGRATAMKFAEHGFRIIMTGRRADRLEALKTDFESAFNCKVKTLPFDVRDLEEVKSMINNLDEEWKNIDVLINNAGLAKGYAPIHEGEIDHWETMIDTNIKGLLYLTRAVAPHMVARKSGHIINVCSSAGKEVYPNGNVYCATKHAVDALTKAMQLDLYKHNIRVGQVSPAHVEETEFAYVRFEDKEKAKIYNDFQPLKSSDVADAIFYIVNTPSYVNVQDIVLMGTQQANSTNIDRSGRK